MLVRAATVIGLLVIAGHASVAVGHQTKKEVTKTRALNAKFPVDNKVYPDVVLVQLYQDGKLLREKEVSNLPLSPLPKSVAWTKLAPGRYEVHFEGRGYARSAKKVFISDEDEDETTIVIEIDQKKSLESGGDGPTLHGLSEEVKKLKEEVARLKAALGAK